MAETNHATELSIAEQRIMSTRLPEWYAQPSPRICLLQIQGIQTENPTVEDKRGEIVQSLNWDYEDYIEEEQGARPEGINPKADVLVCGLGGCTLRIFEATDGSPVRSGECKAADYCLREKFKEVGNKNRSVEEGQALYGEIIDTCEYFVGPSAAGNACPQLSCGLTAGVSVDQVPGTHGSCPKRGLIKLEGFDGQAE